ncbi:MAG: class I SAM-dependent methyltransferase [Gammaproteobacteria bacterium]
MPKTVDDHYAHLLGPVYTWMAGDIDAAFLRSEAELDVLPPAADSAMAVDLGAGFGLHSIPLARRGFSVLALDNCEVLLQDLRQRAGSFPIRVTNENLLNFKAHLTAPVDVILCMGDTLTHLPDQSNVETLFKNAAAALNSGGVFVATFRDYVTAPLEDDARFIPVRNDADRILTCFLEYADTTVTVHDLLHEREGRSWKLHVSSYRKLRLAPQWVAQQLSSLGLEVVSDTVPGRMVRITARQPAASAAADLSK